VKTLGFWEIKVLRNNISGWHAIRYVSERLFCSIASFMSSLVYYRPIDIEGSGNSSPIGEIYIAADAT
jgi:hypothetical protein